MTPFEIKEQGALDTPLFLFDCTFSNGVTYNWSSHHVTVEGTEYKARVLRTNVFEMQTSSEGGVDTIPKITFELANADGIMSELQRNAGFKGATVVVRFVFYSLSQGTATSTSLPVFRGILDSPEITSEVALRVSALNRLSLQRIALPPIRIQKRCPWQFPATAEQRLEALNGGSTGCFSRFYNCGYSPDVSGGCGNSNQGVPFTACDFGRAQCEQRGMFSTDSTGRVTARFGGIEYIPPVISVRSAGDKTTQLSVVQDNEARYNDYVPLIYGSGWYRPSIVFARNDGNLTHFEILLGAGPMTRVTTVLVNDIEIPMGRPGTNMTGTGWYNVVTYGTRTGEFNRDFADASGNPLGDPYGSMAYLQLVVPNSINDGQSTPQIQVLIDGLRLERFDANGTPLGASFSNNPVWIILDILRRSGWSLTEVDLTSFANAAAYCDELIPTTDLNGNTTSTSRFQCNLILQSRRSAGDVIRGVRNASRLYLTYSSGGLLQLKVENTLALQQAQRVDSSNATAMLNGGWPVYEFGDGSNGTTGIARAADQSSTFRITCRGSADTPNRFSVEFQDAFNSFQQDSVTLVNPDDAATCGFEVSATPSVLGVPNFNQATRIIALCLNKSIAGNTYIQFQTSVRALGIQPGDLIAVSHLREGFDRTPFRVSRISPGSNFRRVVIYAQLHDDDWYSDTVGSSPASPDQPRSYRVGVPRPISGITPDGQFGVTEAANQAADGTMSLIATVEYSAPQPVPVNAPGPPLVSLSPVVTPTGGSLSSNSVYYYALTSLDGEGNESPLSFSVPAFIPNGLPTYTVALRNISLPGNAPQFNVYRGPSPAELTRIASNCLAAQTFTDTGFADTRLLPPDVNYDHSNFYWRTELHPPTTVTIHSPMTIGNGSLQFSADQWTGMTVRIMSGKGAHQERLISRNSVSTLTISTPWTVEPDSTSAFAIADMGYQFGASSHTNQVQFGIPNQAGVTIHLCGRAANVYDVENPVELAPVTRWQISGAGEYSSDTDVPAAPTFGLSALSEGGGIELTGVGFEDPANTSTISLGTLTLYYYDEASVDPPPLLEAGLSAIDTVVSLSPMPTFAFPQYVAIDQEVIELTSYTDDRSGFRVSRGAQTTIAATHEAQSLALPLMQLTITFPFVEKFFETPACGNWTQRIVLANAKICTAEFFVTNSCGNSPVSTGSFSGLVGHGLRTLTGGQVTLQVPGPLAIQDNAVPPLDPGAVYSVRDVYAYVGTAPSGTSGIELEITIDGNLYCLLTIGVGDTQSAPVDGSTLAALRAGSKIGLNIQAVGDGAPGSDLTAVIRV